MTQMKNGEGFQTKTFVVSDPRLFDGNPYEVAERAVLQVAGVAAILEGLMDATEKMARNAEMERNIDNGNPPAGSDWPNTAQGRIFARLTENAGILHVGLRLLARAAGYDPKNPPKE